MRHGPAAGQPAHTSPCLARLFPPCQFEPRHGVKRLSAVGRGGLLIQACAPPGCLPARSRMTLINTTRQSQEAITGDTAGAISA